MQCLSDDILWRVSLVLDRATDVLALAQTCRHMYRLLQRQILVADVLEHRRRAVVGQSIARYTILQWAAQAGNTARVRRVLSVAQTLWPPYRDLVYDSPAWTGPALGLAAQAGHGDTVTALLAAGCYAQQFSWCAVDIARGQDTLSATLQPACFLSIIPHGDQLVHVWMSALSLAIAHGHTATALLLVDATVGTPGPQHMARYHRRVDALRLACWCGQLPVVAAMLAADVPANIQGHDGRLELFQSVPPLSLAAAGGHHAVLALLLTHGAHVDGFNASGKTALYWAVLIRHLACTLALLDVPATLAPVMDYEGVSLLVVAARTDEMLPATRRLWQLQRLFRAEAYEAAQEAGDAARETARFMRQMLADAE